MNRKRPNNFELTIPKGQRNIRENIKVLYHVPKEYSNIHKLFDKYPEIKRLLLKVFNYLKDKQIVIYKNRYVFILKNDLASKLRHKTTNAVTSRYMNYLCATGFFIKEKQVDGGMLELNKQFLEKANAQRPINVYRIVRYTKEKLKQIDCGIGQLWDCRIKPSNISSNQLKANYFETIANEIYPLNNTKAFENRVEELQNVIDTLEELMSEKGYASKLELYTKCSIGKSKVDMVLRNFRNSLNELYSYRPPNKATKELYNLNTKKWIFTRKE